jgi:4'-phosphopantetheinyl transferase
MKSPEIQCWIVKLSQCAGKLQGWTHSLSEQERLRAESFQFEADRLRYICGHGLLRQVLGQWLGKKPDELEFRIGPMGRPVLKGQAPAFNISHSGDFVLVALGWVERIGVDVEQIRPIEDLDELVRRHFAAAEIATYGTLTNDETRKRAFFRGFTRKEAYLKAIGTGLGTPLESVETGILAGDRNLTCAPGSGWTLTEFEPGPGYLAAIVAQGQTGELKRVELD